MTGVDGIPTVHALIEAADCPIVVGQITRMKAAGYHRVILIDIVPDALGFPFADAHYVVPPYSDPAAAERAIDEIRVRENINLVIPSVDEGLLFWAGQRDRWAGLGVQVLISSSATVALCVDKLETFRFLEKHGFHTPATGLSYDPERPLMKPRRGRGGQGQRLWPNAPQGDVQRDVLWQAFVEGAEYTVDLLCHRPGEVLYAVVRRRLEVLSGISVGGLVVDFPALEAEARRFAALARLFGPANIQFIVADDKAFIIDVNPRTSGGQALALEATENWYAIYPQLAGGIEPRPKPLQIGKRMRRYFCESFS